MQIHKMKFLTKIQNSLIGWAKMFKIHAVNDIKTEFMRFYYRVLMLTNKKAVSLPPDLGSYTKD